MLFFPIAILLFLFFLFWLPFLFLLFYFNFITLGFEKLGISPEITTLILFFILLGSIINIPLIRKKLIYSVKPKFFGLFQTPQIEVQGIFINFGGGIVPILLSFYFIYLAWQRNIGWEPIFIAAILMIFICRFLAKIVPGKGIKIPALLPAIFSTIFSFVFVPDFAGPAAFISGVFGVLVGADLLNLKKMQAVSPGFLSIGGAGVFDAIFLIGIISALISGISH